MIYTLLGDIVSEASEFNGDESQRERIMRLNKEFSEAFSSGKTERLSLSAQIKYTLCVNTALLSLIDPKRHNELASRAQDLYAQLPMPRKTPNTAKIYLNPQ